MKKLIVLGMLMMASLTAITQEHSKKEVIAWHKSFSEACAEAQKQQKPILVFNLLGKLDEEFC